VLLPEYKDPNPGKFDLLSAVLSLTGVLSVIFGLKQIAQNGVGLVPILFIALGLVIGFVFVRRQRSLADPLIDLRLFRERAFSASLVTYTLGVFVAFGSFLFIAQYLQLVLGLSPLMAGLWTVPGAIANVFGSNIAPRLVRRIRPAYVVAGGLALTASGLAMLTQVGADSLAIIVIGNFIMSFGFGLTFTLTADLVVGTAPPERAGAASAISETGAEFGGALGIAVLGSLGMAIYRSYLAGALPSGIPPETLAVAQETLGGAAAAAAQLSDPQIGGALLSAAHEAFVKALQVVGFIGAVSFTSLAIMTMIVLRHVRPHDESEDQPEPEQAHRHPIARPQPEAQTGD
jgi:MFS transporter, DHA2 family, multidrug resistance protein